MTKPAAETLEREKDKLFLTEAELIRWMGLPENKTTRLILRGLVEKGGFPRKQKVFGRYYRPAVKQWLDRHGGVQGGQ